MISFLSVELEYLKTSFTVLIGSLNQMDNGSFWIESKLCVILDQFLFLLGSSVSDFDCLITPEALIFERSESIRDDNFEGPN